MDYILSFFQGSFKGETNSIDENMKIIIKDNISEYEAELIKISNTNFSEWAENLFHLTNSNLYDTVVAYFSIFTTIIDVILSCFPEDSQIFLQIVQAFLSNVIQNDELMINIYNSICYELPNFISNSNHFESKIISLNTILSIFKSFHIIEKFYLILHEYKFDFSAQLSIDPIRDTMQYLSEASRRYLNGIKLFTKIYSFDQTNLHTDEIERLSNLIFNQIVTSKMFKLTSGVRPPIGKLLTTPLVSWIYETLLNQKKNNENLIFEIISLYEGCANYIYDIILMFSIEKADHVAIIIKIIEILTTSYCNIFNQTNGSINYLETSILTAINDDRMKFFYNFADFLDRIMESAFLNNESVWMTFINEINESTDECFNDFKLPNIDEFHAKSLFIKYVNRIENKNGLFDLISGSINNLLITYDMKIMNTIQPLLELFQLVIGIKLEIKQNKTEEGKLNISTHSNQIESHHHSHCHCSRKPQDIQVEALLTFKNKEISIFTDFLTVSVIQHLISNGPSTIDQIAQSLKINANDVEDRLITLSSSLISSDDNVIFSFNQNYDPPGKFIRFPPFFECNYGELEQYKLRVIKNKVKLAIKTKGSIPFDVFMFDSFLLLKRKLRPDTAMILKASNELKEEKIIEENNGIVTYLENSE